MNKKVNRRFMLIIEVLTAEMTYWLMKDKVGMSLSDAILFLHTSQWYHEVSNPATELYLESGLYNYELLRHELKLGNMCP